MINLNIQCLSAKVTYVKALQKMYDLNILCLTEHWLRDQQIMSINFDEMFVAAHFSRKNGIHGGSCILLKNDWLTAIINRNDLMMVNEEFHFELSAVEIKGMNLVIFCVYRSPTRGSREVFYNKLAWVLEKTSQEGKRVILSGDFNFDFLNTRDRAQLCELLTCHQLKQTVTSPTRITQSSSSCLDNIFTDLDFSNVTVFETGYSDHCAQKLSVSLNCVSEETTKIETVCRRINSRTLAVLSGLLENADWSDVYSQSDVNEMFRRFMARFTLAFEMACPESKMGKCRTDKPVAPEIKRLLAEIADAGLLVKNCPPGDLRAALRRRIKQLKDQVDLVTKQKNSLAISRSDNVSKSAWQIIKSNVTLKPMLGGPTSLKIDDNEMTSTTAIVNELGKHYIHLPTPPEPDLSALAIVSQLAVSPSSSMFLPPVTADELSKLCKKIKNRSSRDVYGLSVKVLKMCWPQLVQILTYMINMSITSGIFPDHLKRSEIVPVYKKGPKNLAKNWRAISICPVLSKVWEKVMAERLMDYLETINYFTLRQFGFRKERNTTDALYSFISCIYEKRHNRETVVGMFCDLSRAFDMVPHCELLAKLEFWGIRGNALQLFSSYLKDRSQRVRLRDALSGAMEYSAWLPVTKGVPAGSILGPLFFIFYINDVANYVQPYCVPTLFADDTSMVISSMRGNVADLCDSVIRRASKWFEANRLILNADKTIYLNLTSNNEINSFRANGVMVDFEHSTKFLGITLSSNLSWEKHIDALCLRLCQGIYLLRTLSNLIDLPTLKLVYHACFEAHMAYGICFWYGTTAAQINRVFVLQKKAIRTIFRLHPRAHCSEYFKRLNVLSLPGLYMYHLLYFTHNNARLFEWSNGRRGRLVVGPRVHTEGFRLSPQYRAFKLFNKLSERLRGESRKNIFKRAVWEGLFSLCPYSIPDALPF